MNSDVISITMATYNGEKYIQAQLDSILAQTYQPLEIIIVDDSSTDNTVKLIKDYQIKHSNITLIQNLQNQGVVRSFELAINNCSGDYIALADQDDVWVVNKLEELHKHIGEALLIHSDAILVDADLQIISNSYMQYSKSNHYRTLCDYLLGNNVTGCCSMFRRSLWQQTGYIPQGFYTHDHYLAIMASAIGGTSGIKYYAKPLVYYRQHSANAIGAKIKDYSKFIEQMQKVHSSITLLKDNKILNVHMQEIKIVLCYYDALINHLPANIRINWWVYKHVPLKKFCGFIAFTCFGRSFAKFIYSKLR